MERVAAFKKNDIVKSLFLRLPIVLPDVNDLHNTMYTTRIQDDLRDIDILRHSDENSVPADEICGVLAYKYDKDENQNSIYDLEKTVEYLSNRIAINMLLRKGHTKFDSIPDEVIAETLQEVEKQKNNADEIDIDSLFADLNIERENVTFFTTEDTDIIEAAKKQAISNTKQPSESAEPSDSSVFSNMFKSLAALLQ